MTAAPDAFNALALPSLGAPEPATDRSIVRASNTNDQREDSWRCLHCLAGGHGSRGAVDLALIVHDLACVPDRALSSARQSLLEVISDRSESEYAAAWADGIEERLLRRGGLWAMLADALGWPVGWLGLSGWDPDLRAAMSRYGMTHSDFETPALTARTPASPDNENEDK